MKSKPITKTALEDDELIEIPPFDFNKAIPLPLAARARGGVTTTVHKTDGSKEVFICLDADVAKKFRSVKAFNAALRKIIHQP